MKISPYKIFLFDFIFIVMLFNTSVWIGTTAVPECSVVPLWKITFIIIYLPLIFIYLVMFWLYITPDKDLHDYHIDLRWWFHLSLTRQYVYYLSEFTYLIFLGRILIHLFAFDVFPPDASPFFELIFISLLFCSKLIAKFTLSRNKYYIFHRICLIMISVQVFLSVLLFSLVPDFPAQIVYF